MESVRTTGVLSLTAAPTAQAVGSALRAASARHLLQPLRALPVLASLLRPART